MKIVAFKRSIHYKGCVDMIGNEIKKQREVRGISQTTLGRELGVRQSTVAMWESGKNSPTYETLLRIADFFGVSTDALRGEAAPVTKIPVLGRVAAGPPIYAAEDIIGYVEVSDELSSSGEFFALQIKGNSMEPRFEEGDTVIVRRQPCVENGEIAIVLIGQEEATCKKFYRTDDGIRLVSINPQYPPMVFPEDKLNDTKIDVLGRVCELRAKF